jgi:zinc protease
MKWALLIGVVVLTACRPHPPAAPVRKTSLGLGIEYLELGNGLKVVIVEDPRATQIQVTMRYRVGAIDDPADQEGMAHLVEHLMFQQVLGGQSLFDQLENHASSFNGTTSLDATTYWSRATRDRLDKLLSIEAVRVGFRCTTITDATFEREREVVINELREREPRSAVYLAVQRAIYPVGHPYARPSSTEAALRSITREQACAFADAHYTTRNSVLVVSGDLTRQLVTDALQKFLIKLPARPAAPAASASAPPARRVELPGPVDSELVVIGWPLPTDPKLRAQMRAVLGSAIPWIDDRVKGRVQAVMFGDQQAPLAGVAIELAEGETATEALTAASKAMNQASATLGALDQVDLGGVAYDRIRQTAVHRIFAELEDGSSRDVRLATEVLAGRDPRLAVAAELEGLRELTRETMVNLADSALQMDRASVLVMTPAATAPHTKTELAPPVHDQGQRRDPPDPALARQPITKELAGVGVPTKGFASMRTRTLPNGLAIVLLPIASVPTVDIRMVFRAGASDDPKDASGAAKVAGHGLTWNLHHFNDLLLFAGAGGTQRVDVGTDHVEFGVRGMEMHLDALLAGLRRWVVEGQYGSDTEAVALALRSTVKEGQHEGALFDAWTAALFGKDHPYAKFGSARQLSPGLAGTDGKLFHDAHLTPDNATLVISGGFDPALADRWIDYLFKSWAGTAAPRSDRVAEFRRVSLAHEEPAEQTLIRLAFPVASKARANQLVLAEILAIVVAEVRHQLGASYGVHASLHDARLGPRYQVVGYIETRRLVEAMQLIHQRLDLLQDDADEAARMFVTARARVLTRLTALSGRPSELSDQIVEDVVHDRAPLSALATALAVQKLTLPAVDLGELDLDRAAVLMQGPRDQLDPAFLALGRIATYVTAPATTPAPAATPTRPMLVDSVPHTLELPLTYQGPRNPLGFIFGVTYGSGGALDGDLTGYQLTARVLYKFDRRTSFGAGLTVGNFEGTAVLVERMPPAPIDVLPVGVTGGLQASFWDRGWLGAYLGFHADRVIAAGVTTWRKTGGFELMGGVDLVELRGNRLAIYGRIDAAPLGDISFTSFTAGLAYRRTKL